jgi:galactokinase
LDDIVKAFRKKFSAEDVRMVKSPLRICPLGAHVDHQGGLVTGMAIDSSVNMVYAPSKDGYIRIQSLDFPDEEYFHIDRVPDMVPGFWGNYIRGAVLSLKRNHILKTGLEAIISGKIPIGGLSSSAAVTTAYLLALCDVNQVQISKMDLIQYSHWVETDFIGLKNGILDQAANILSKNNHLMYMDCMTNEYQLLEKNPAMQDFEIVIVYSGLSKSLISTDYNNRVDECKVSGWILQELCGRGRKELHKMRLREIPVDAYKAYREQVPGKFGLRLDHFFGEMERVEKGIEAWQKGDINTFGRLMFESGESSISKYECGCPELIEIFNLLKKCQGVYGARFSGAGYRGCCIGLIDPLSRQSIKEYIDKEYLTKYPEYEGRYNIYFCKTDDGARIIESLQEL